MRQGKDIFASLEEWRLIVSLTVNCNAVAYSTISGFSLQPVMLEVRSARPLWANTFITLCPERGA
tara:strand:- start:410 stop:604 length:195 start_codon:yes stop_codon:yes gene_type:complete